MALETASSSRTRTASSRGSTPFVTRARNSATVAVTAAIVYAASSNAFISRFPAMIQIAAGSHITRHQRRMRQDGRAGSKGCDGCTWMVALQTYHDRRTVPESVINSSPQNSAMGSLSLAWSHHGINSYDGTVGAA